jgi:hypothetical protein
MMMMVATYPVRVSKNKKMFISRQISFYNIAFQI